MRKTLTFLVIVSVIYLLLSVCEWSLNPNNWYGMSRLIWVVLAVVFLMVIADRKDL